MAEKEKKEKKRLLTPIGVCQWAHLFKPKVFEKDGVKGKPQFMIDIVFKKDDPLWAPWAEKIVQEIRALPDQWNNKAIPPEKLRKQFPIKNELDKEDKPTGNLTVTFKTSANFKPDVFDRYLRPIPDNVKIGNGSKVQVSYTPVEYDGFGGGIALYLNAVKVIDLVEFQASSGAAHGFTADEIPEEGAPPVPGEKPQPPPPEDDLPF